MRRAVSVPTLAAKEKKKADHHGEGTTTSAREKSLDNNNNREDLNTPTSSDINYRPNPSPPNDDNDINFSRPSSGELTFDDYQNFEYFEATSQSPISLEQEYYNNISNTNINNIDMNNSHKNNSNNNLSQTSHNSSNSNLSEMNFSSNINANGSSAEKGSSLRVHALNGKLREYESPKLTEVYGFVGWMVSWLALFIFLLWAFLPEEYWNDFGVTYYPNRYWALAIPAYLLMSYFFLCIVHVGIALMRTPAFSSAALISDEFTREARDFTRLAKSSKSTVGTPEIYDIPLSVTNRLIYSKRGKLESGYKNTRYRYRFGQSRSAMKSRRGVAMKQNGNNNKNMSPTASSSIFPTDGLQRIRSLPTR